ncbi:hypothetical protein EJB05_56633, partial [Eragrostis curvula]
MAQQAVFSVLERASMFAIDEAKFLLGVYEKVESAKMRLMQMQGFLKDVDDKMLKGGAAARGLVSQIRGVAYEVEDIMDSANILMKENEPKTSTKVAIRKYACFPVYLTHLHKLGARIDSANAKMTEILDDFQKLNIAAAAITQDYTIEDDATQQWRTVHPDFDEDVDVIGFDDQIEQIRNDLLDSENKNLTVVSIVGPGGAGKSTMAKKVYGLAAVHFEVHAWITVSQRPITLDIFKEMASRLIPSDVLEKLIKGIAMLEKSHKELKDLNHRQTMTLLYDFLSKKRYLIVLDDVWQGDAWDAIRPIFSDVKNSSRIVLTTRKQAVAQHPNARKKIYKPRKLATEESVQLLLSIALPEYNLVDGGYNATAARQNLAELQKLGEDLAVKCDGLPLAVSVVGGYLYRNLDVAEWKRLTSSMDWQDMISTEKGIGDVLNLSYYDMPSYLKSCFMCTIAFPTDSLIDVQVLARLWVAEGFIHYVRGHTREEIAIKYVEELVQRCMIQVEERACSGKITVIRVHDILRNWGIRQARIEGFMKDCYSAPEIAAPYSEEEVEAYRMVLHGFRETRFVASMRKLRSLLAFSLQTEEVDKSLQDLHRLRVLYLHSLECEVHLPREIGRMRYLRYLGFGGTGTYHLPSSVGDLLSLETLDATGGRIHHIPASLWKIPALKQVHISRARGWSVPRISLQSNVHAIVLSSISDLHTRSARESNYVLEAWRIMEATKRQLSEDKNPNLSCCFGMTYDMKVTGNQMDIVGKCEADLRFPNDFPDFDKTDNITVLKIRCAKLLNNDQKMLELSRMKFLMVLEIGEQSCTEVVLTCPGGSFQCLVQLILYDLAVKDWKLGHDSMIRLRELTICKCPNLSYLPEELLLLPHLSKLELIEMPTSCYEQDMVAWELTEKGCHVFKSTELKDFHRLDLPVASLMKVEWPQHAKQASFGPQLV